MKKPTKPASGKSDVSKHAKSSAKPVTLDLKAEKVDTKEVSSAKATESVKKNAARSSVPKSSGKSNPANSPFGRKRDHSDDPNPSTDTVDQSSAVDKNVEELATKSNQDKAENVKSSGKSGKFAPALIGGVVALAGAAILQTTGILPSGSNSKTTFIEQSAFENTKQELLRKIAALENRLTNANSQTDIDAAVEKKITELSASGKLSGTTDGSLDEVSTQVNETTIRVEKLQNEVASISKTMSDLNTAISSGEAGDTAAVSNLSTQVDNISRKLESYSSDITSLKAETAELASKTTAPSTAPEKITSAITALQSALPELKETVSKQISSLQNALTDRLNGLDEKTTSLSGSLGDLRDKATKDAQTNVQTARAIAAAALKNDIDNGQSFDQSLETLVALANNDESLTALKAFAETGVPTTDQIKSSFEALKPQLFATLQEKPADDLSSRLLAGAKSLVKIQSLNPESNKGPDADIAAISSKLSNNDLIGAEIIWTQLPPQAKEVSSKWHDQIKARITVDGLISNTIQTYLISAKTQ